MLTGVNFYASSNYALTGQGVTLNWSSGNGISCTASGGVVGDGWSRLRILPPSGGGGGSDAGGVGGGGGSLIPC